MFAFTRDGARRAARDARLEAWVQAFLRGPGGNLPFAQGLLLEPRAYMGPIDMPLDALTPVFGPGIQGDYQMDEPAFARHVAAMADAIARGWDMPPLIVQYVQGAFVLTDGNHRYAALRARGITHTPAVIWLTGEGDRAAFCRAYPQWAGGEG